MKIMYKSLLVLAIILLTGCSLFKGSMGQPVEENPSELQQALESFVEDNNNLEDKADEYKNTIDEALNSLNEQENNENTENSEITE